MKRVLSWIGRIVLAAVSVVAAFVVVEVALYQHSVSKKWDVPPLALQRSSDRDVIARGKHLAESIGACATSDCHGADLGGGRVMSLGPIGTLSGPNITPAGRAAQYSDGELARLIVHGIRRDGTTVRFMPARDLSWLPDDDLVAIISYVRSVPPVARPDGPFKVGVLAKVLDRLGRLAIDQARVIDHQHRPEAPTPAPTVAYGRYLANLCTGCHGDHLSGGPIPGAPPSLPVPLNLTPDRSGLEGWTYEDFDKLLATGVRKCGKKLDPFMPVEAFGKMNDVERHAMWAYLQSLPPRPFGGR